MATLIRTSWFGRALGRFHAFHIRYRWAFLLIAVSGTIIIIFGAGELGKALFGLGLEQVLLHVGEWARAAEPVAEEAAKDATELA